MAASMFKAICFAVFLISQVNCWIPRLINGRPKGGFLGAPKVLHPVETPPAQWYEEQRLDHFDGSNVQVWNQVREL